MQCSDKVKRVFRMVLLVYICIVFCLCLTCLALWIWYTYTSGLSGNPKVRVERVGSNATSLLGCYDPSVTRRIHVVEADTKINGTYNTEFFKEAKSNLIIENIILNSHYIIFGEDSNDRNVPVNYWSGDNPVYVASQGTLFFEITAIDNSSFSLCSFQFFLFNEWKNYHNFLDSGDPTPAYFSQTSGCLSAVNMRISFNFTLPTQGYYFIAAHIKEFVEVNITIGGSLTSYVSSDIPREECSLNVGIRNCTIIINEEKVPGFSQKNVCILAKSLVEESSNVNITQENADWNATSVMLFTTFIFLYPLFLFHIVGILVWKNTKKKKAKKGTITSEDQVSNRVQAKPRSTMETSHISKRKKSTEPVLSWYKKRATTSVKRKDFTTTDIKNSVCSDSSSTSDPKEETLTVEEMLTCTDTDTELTKMKVTEENLLGHTLSVNQPEFVCSSDDEEEYDEFASDNPRAKPVRKDSCGDPLLEHSATSEDSETSTFPPTLVSGTVSQENPQNLPHVSGLECEDLISSTSESQNKMEVKINTIGEEENDFETIQKEVPFNEKGLFHHSHEYGVTIIIPEGAVQGPATLQFGASLLLTDFKSEGLYEPVSPFVWVHTNPALSKPAELYIPHYAMADTIEDRMKLYLLTRGHEKNAVFKVNNELEANISSALVRISGTHFCTACLGSTPVTKRRYLVAYATKELTNGALNIDLCVLYSDYCLEIFRKRYKGYNIFYTCAPFKSGGVRVKVELPKNSDWESGYREFEQEYISEDQIDFYKKLGCHPGAVPKEARKTLKRYEDKGLYPSCVKISFIPTQSPTNRCQAKITLFGQDGDISIPIQLRGDALGPPPSAISTPSSDSGFSNTSLSDSLQLSERKTTNDVFIIDVMSFLESRLTTDYIKFGYYLGLDMNLLHQIGQSTGHDMKCCVSEVLFHWRKCSPDASHECVAKALKASGYDLLSAMVTLRYGENQSATFCTICQKNHGPEISDSNLLNHVLGDSDILKTEPKLADLMSLIGTKIPAKWELFGAQLNIEQSRMDALGTENPRNCDLCFQHLFDVWKRTRSSPVTWLTVIKALYSIAEYVLAENVYRQITT